MGFFGPTKGSIKQVVDAKIKAGQPHGTGAATQVQARQAKARKKEIQEAAKRRKQEERDIRRAKLIKGPPNAGKAKKFNEKAIAAGDKRRAKAAAKKEARKAKGFWG